MLVKKIDFICVNIYVVFYMCQLIEGIVVELILMFEVEFYNDEFFYGYFFILDRVDIMMLDDIRDNFFMGDFVFKFDSLDDFFDDFFISLLFDGCFFRIVIEFFFDVFEFDV